MLETKTSNDDEERLTSPSLILTILPSNSTEIRSVTDLGQGFFLLAVLLALIHIKTVSTRSGKNKKKTDVELINSQRVSYSPEYAEH